MVCRARAERSSERHAVQGEAVLVIVIRPILAPFIRLRLRARARARNFFSYPSGFQRAKLLRFFEKPSNPPSSPFSKGGKAESLIEGNKKSSPPLETVS